MPHTNPQERPLAPKPLHPPLKLDTAGETAHDKWGNHYIIPHTTTRRNDAAKSTVTRRLPNTTQVSDLTAPKVLITHR